MKLKLKLVVKGIDTQIDSSHLLGHVIPEIGEWLVKHLLQRTSVKIIFEAE